jgi:TPR repeat protein
MSPVNNTASLLLQLQEQAEGGDGAAACRLGDAYREGEGTRRNLKLALQWYRRGAELGDGYAQNNVGSMLLNGMGCKRNPVKATHWYRSSAEQGNAEGQYNLAQRYLTGDGIDQDYGQARFWFEQAAMQGDVWSACQVGTLYWLGHGVERNLLAAAEFHLIAAESGDEVACRNLSQYRAELEEIALAGDSMACWFLSRIHSRALGVERSQSLAWGWISLAKKFCGPSTDAEIAQEVSDLYSFHQQCISPELRREGQKAVASRQKKLPGETEAGKQEKAAGSGKKSKR